MVFGWPIFSDKSVLYSPALSGGSWSATLPLANLQDRQLAEVTRSTNALAASTQFEVDLGVARSVRVLALPKHNISAAGTIRARSSSVAGDFSAPISDTGTLNVWPTGLDAEKIKGMNLGWTHVLISAAVARYWLFEIVDTGNPAGYVELARLVIAGGWQPTINLEYGAKIGLLTDTTRSVSDGGAAWYDSRPVRRSADFTIGHLDDTEALERGFDMQRIAGISDQLMFIFDPNDTAHMHRRSFLAVLQELTALEYPYSDRSAMAFRLIEEL